MCFSPAVGAVAEVWLSSVGSVLLMMVSLRSQVFSGVVSVDWLTAGRFISQRAAERCCSVGSLTLIASFTGVQSSVGPNALD